MEEYCEVISSEGNIGYHFHEYPALWLPAQDLKNIKSAKFPHRGALSLTDELLDIGFYRGGESFF